ncbi:MAG TPA: hypothetical protein VL261_16885 [Nitrospira sp.]|nr:hypothetical protein [Nitrospira sp.]
MSTIFFLKLGMLVFWGAWYVTAFATNFCDMLQALRILPNTWRFASGNLHSVIKTTAIYSTPRRLPHLLFFGVLCWQFLVWLSFGWAIISSLAAGAINVDAMNMAFFLGLGLWAAFMLADEIFKQYDTEHAHALFFIAQLTTFIALHLLPS